MHFLYLADDHADWLTLRPTTSDQAAPLFDYDRREVAKGGNMIGAVRELAVHWRADRGRASVNVGVLSPATVLPLAEFEESTVETVYQFVFDGRRAPKTPRRVFYDMLPSSNGVLLFGVEERNCTEIEQELGEVHYFSPFSGLLQWMAGRKQTARQRRIFVHCRSTQIDVAYFEGHRIFAFNTFDVQTADDVLYFTCQLARQFDVDFSATPFIICGRPDKMPVVAACFRPFVAEVECVDAAPEFDCHPLTELSLLPFELLTNLLN